MKGGANVLSALVELHAKERRLAALLHGKCWWEELAPLPHHTLCLPPLEHRYQDCLQPGLAYRAKHITQQQERKGKAKSKSSADSSKRCTQTEGVHVHRRLAGRTIP